MREERFVVDSVQIFDTYMTRELHDYLLATFPSYYKVIRKFLDYVESLHV